MLPTFEGKKDNIHNALFNEHFKSKYIRAGEWKLVSLSSNTSWHLYKINDDQTELHDVAKQYPEVVQRLSERWKEWADTHWVFPNRTIKL